MKKFIEVDPVVNIVPKTLNISKKHLVIMTPCYGGVCHVNYTICLMNTRKLLESENITLSIEFCRCDSLITRARNNIIGKAMNDSSITHFMFIDSDITWDPNDILNLINSDKSFIGGIYPLKRYIWSNVNDELLSSISKIKDINIMKQKGMTTEDILRSKLIKYNLNYINNNVEIKNNLMEVRHIATGFMMFKREVIIQMQNEYSETKYIDDVGFLDEDKCNFTYALFDCAVLDGHYLSEDWLFCERWRKIGGKIFVDVSIDLTHTGTEDYKGSILTSLL
jgi:hypothetical protein